MFVDTDGIVAYTRVRGGAVGRRWPPMSESEDSPSNVASSLALLGEFSEFLPAQPTAVTGVVGGSCDCAEPGADTGAFKTHRVLRFSDDSPGRLRPHWNPTVHILELSEGISAPLNDALWRDIHKVRASEDGLIISNRGGGFHSTQHLFQRGTPALQQLERIVSEAITCATAAEAPPPSSSSDSSSGDECDALPASLAPADRRSACTEGGGRPLKQARAYAEAGRGVEQRDGGGCGDSAVDGRCAPRPLEYGPSESWANVCEPESYHALHDHEGALFSGVYYVRVPEGAGGVLLLRTAVGQCGGDGDDGKQDDRMWCRYSTVRPVPGRLVLFPGWLPHCVTPVLAPGSPIVATGNADVGKVDGGQDGVPGAAVAVGTLPAVRVSISFNVGTEG